MLFLQVDSMTGARPEARAVVRGLAMPPFDPLNRRAAQLRAEGHHVISLGQAVPFFPPPEEALRAARFAMADDALHRYTTDPGLPSLRHALAERLSVECGQSVTSADLIVTAGANHAFTLAVATVVGPGDEVVVPTPYFTNHQMVLVVAGAVVVEAPLADTHMFALRWDDLAPHITPRTRAVVLCNPSNPTGAAIDASEGRRIVNELSSRGVFVISDETYMQFVYDGGHWSAASVPGWRDNVIVVGTFSKSFGMMGWRVGYLLADAGLCEQAIKVQDATIICAPVVSQMAAEGAVRGCWDYPVRQHAALRARRETLRRVLAAIPRATWSPTRGGLFAFVRIEGCMDSTTLAYDLLERAHVVTIPGAAFGPAGEGYLRLSFGYAGEDEIGEAGHRLVSLLDQADV